MHRVLTRTSWLLVTLTLVACPAKKKQPEQQAPTPGDTAQCVAQQQPIAPVLPWKNAAELCAQANRGQSWDGAKPPLGLEWVTETDAYAEEVQRFLRSLAYRSAPYSWLHDANWRLTGPYEGCPPTGHDKGPHPAVRIYYSPEVIDWMCRYRQGENELPDAADMPTAMIIKEMMNPDNVELALVPGTDKLWIAPKPGEPADYYDQGFDSWTIMIKDSRGAADGWYYAYFGRTGTGNPPMWDRAAFAEKPFPGSDGVPVTEPPGGKWYPTYWNYSLNDVQFPNYGFGNYCVYCHASAQGENTFSSFTNILGQEIRYEWLREQPSGTDVASHPISRPATATAEDPRAPFPSPRPLGDPLPGFRDTFPELNPSYAEVWATRIPAQTWDHTPSMVGVEGVPAEHSEFLTSDQCLGCHEAGGAGQLDMPYMVVTDRVTNEQIDVSPYAEWSVSPMGLGGRDPIFHAQLELERNIARDQPGLRGIRDCIDNTCLHCHGAPGARQYNIDTAGQGPADDPCKAFLPAPPERRATNYDGALFTRDMVMAWRDEQPEKARYGALARDGINCTICHRMSATDLDQDNLKKTFTGNYRVGPPDKLYGPFPNPDSPAAVLPRPMENALGITPEYAPQVARSELCGTCHTVFLPVFDDRGELAGTAYEQTTYLEWLLSSFARGEGEKSCQDCHMPHTHQGQEITTGIANIQDSRYPEADFLLPDKDVDNPKRPYNRHGLYGLNAFLNAFFQQFPLLLGYRQQDFMNGNVRAPLLTGRETVLEIAREETATVAVSEPRFVGDALEATVTVTNLGGHSLPSGVGFRRLFVEFLVLDSAGRVLWSSGRTNDIGVLVDADGQTLATEFWQAGPDGLPFQAHHQVITDSRQVQIYEEATQNSSLQFTSSFVHRYWEIKDNRLRPKGWNPSAIEDPSRREEYRDATEPGTGPHRHWWPLPKRDVKYRNKQFPGIARYKDTAGDPDYDLAQHAGAGLPGRDSLVYRVTLAPDKRGSVAKIRATLYSQSTPPHYLKERFVQAAKEGAEKTAAQRLYFMAGHLNTQATAADGKPYLDGYKLRVGQAVEVAVEGT